MEVLSNSAEQMDRTVSTKLVQIDQTYITSIAKLKGFVDQARVYPLQADIVDVFGLPTKR